MWVIACDNSATSSSPTPVVVAASPPPLPPGVNTPSPNSIGYSPDIIVPMPVPSPPPPPTDSRSSIDASTTSTTDGGSSSLSVGAIVGIAVGGVAVLAAVAALFMFIVAKKQREKKKDAGASLPSTYSTIAPPTKPLSVLSSSTTATVTSLAPSPFDTNTNTNTNTNTTTMTTASGVSSVAATTDVTVQQSQSQTPIIFSSSSSGGATDPLNLLHSGQLQQQRQVSSSTSRGPLQAWELDFNDIKLEKSIGAGSWGHVYKGNWKETSVAVKILLDTSSTQTASDTTQSQMIMNTSNPILTRLEQEASIMTQLHHPNAVQFLGLTVSPASIVTEYCARGNLTSVLQQALAAPEKAAEMSWGRRMALLADCCRGMIYLHGRNPPIIHRDLKSPNLLVTQHWKCKVSDFNLSKIMQDATKSTSLAAMNPRWLAPEILMGQNATKASDVFAFGVIMWEMLTWAIPWKDVNPWSIVSTVTGGGRLTFDVDALPVGGGERSKDWKGLEKYVDVMYNRCMVFDATKRAGFEEVMAALKDLGAGDGDGED